MKFLVIAGILLLGFIVGFGLGSIPFTSANIATETFEPTVRIPQSNISLSKQGAQINSEGMLWAVIADTGSMKPTLTKNSHVLQIRPTRPEELQVGDIISYKYQDTIIIHRIISTGFDDEGWFAIAKGDNNQLPDREKVRFEQIDRVVVGIIY